MIRSGSSAVLSNSTSARARAAAGRHRARPGVRDRRRALAGRSSELLRPRESGSGEECNLDAERRRTNLPTITLHGPA
ncbi:hypothetical protein Ae717Ps2_6630c [Pseudonocardia sp. Ae717_Ps2]|nr:hypothetical protein Ae717Ps2_6590c [Pseudonocardia sp. Ae717_Ps2]OLM28291.1 hypothetical protein Ae717Ps2_6630c [Pseudonocardia sp. Ae717_Ps2]